MLEQLQIGKIYQFNNGCFTLLFVKRFYTQGGQRVLHEGGYTPCHKHQTNGSIQISKLDQVSAKPNKLDHTERRKLNRKGMS